MWGHIQMYLIFAVYSWWLNFKSAWLDRPAFCNVIFCSIGYSSRFSSLRCDFPLQSSFLNVPLLNIIKMSVQVVCKDYITSMEASMFQIFHLPLHRGMLHLVVSHQVEFNNLGEAFQVDDLHQTIFQLPCLRFDTSYKCYTIAAVLS